MPLRRRCTVLALLAWALPAAAFAAGPQYAFFRAPTDAAKALADESQCRETAAHESLPSSLALPPSYDLIGGVAGELITERDDNRAQRRVWETYAARCMRKMGYVPLTLTPQEIASREAAKSDDEKKAWLAAFYAQDLSTRVNAETHPLVPPFAELPPAAFAIAGFRIDPASLHAADGPVKKFDTLLSGAAVHRRTGRLTAAYKIPGTLRIVFPAGEALHEMPNPYPELDSTTLWCGDATAYGILAHNTHTWCLGAEPSGYVLFNGLGLAWAVGTVPAPTEKSHLLAPVTLEESDKDLMGPVSIAVSYGDIDKHEVIINFIAQKDGKQVEIWRATYPFDDQGRAVVPLWTKRLVLTHGDNALIPTLTDGDGAGPER